MRENRLICSAVAEFRIFREDIVHECGSAAPMSDYEYRILNVSGRSEIPHLPFIDTVEPVQNPVHPFRTPRLAEIRGVRLHCPGHLVESSPVSPDKGVHRKVFKTKKSHQYLILTLSICIMAPGQPT